MYEHAKFLIARKRLNGIAASQNDIVFAEIHQGATSRHRVHDTGLVRRVVANGIVQFRVTAFREGSIDKEALIAIAVDAIAPVLLVHGHGLRDLRQ